MADTAANGREQTGGQDVRALLKVSRGSTLGPIALLLITLVAFIGYWLPSGRDQLINEFGRMCQNVRPGIGKNPGLVGLSVEAYELSDKQKKAKVKPPGVVVVDARHPAWALNGNGLKENQLVSEVDGQPTRTPKEFVEAILKRDPAKGTVDLKLASQPPRTLTITPPTAPKPSFDAAGLLVGGPKNYRDWCVSADGPPVALLKADIVKRGDIWSGQVFTSFHKSEFLGARGILRLASGYTKTFMDDVFVAMGTYWLKAIGIVLSALLFALIPGLAGMIYRRAFWTWFGIAFVGFLAIRSIVGNLGQLMADGGGQGQTATAAAAGLVVFIIAQLAVILLTSRMRRHTAKPPFIATLLPAKTYNRILWLALIVAAIGIGILAWGAKFWTWLPFDPTWSKWNFIIFGLPFIYYLLKVTPAWSGKKPKNIVICLDGTSNTPDQYDMGLSAQTNVFKLFKLLKADKPGSFAPTGRFDATLCKTYQDKQVALYYTGIGNTFDNDPVIGTLSQATGLGASGIVERAYLDLIRTWRPGDRVFIFGFSRGAASARILSRMIDQRGAPRSIWTMRLLGRHWTMWPSSRKAEVNVDVLGCWDTVGSFGVAKTIAGIDFQKVSPHDLSVPENVRQAYHLVALDEDRQEFEPTLMDPDPIRPERIVEVWFAGGHAGVGGGWATDRLSDVAFDFLLRRVSSGYCADGSSEPGDESWGIHLAAANGMNEAAKQKAAAGLPLVYPDPLGQLRTYISSIYNYRPRTLPLHAVISETVFERMTKSLPVYAPQALFNLNDALDAKRDLIAEKLKALQETNSLDDTERAKVMEFANKLRLTRFPQYWAELLAARSGSAPPVTPAHVLANTQASEPAGG